MKILSHNWYWAQGHPFDTDLPGEPREEILLALAKMYRRAEADLLCLQEVQDEAAFRRVADALCMQGCFTPGGELTQYGGATLWRGGGGELVHDSAGSGPPPQRMWQLVRTPPGLVVANVHLPSSRQLGAERAAAARIAELETMLGAADAPDVVLGDFNEQPGGPVGDLLSGRGYLDAAVLSGRSVAPSSVGGGRGDQIWLRGGLGAALVEYAVSGPEDMATQVAGKEYLSDHFGLWVVLDTEGLGA